MHQKFADWYRPVTFGHDREALNLRWQGIEAALEGLDFSLAMELVRLVLGRPLFSMENADTFRQYFKTIDQTFPSTGNDQELQVLAGCVLAVICLDGEHNLNGVPLAILTASACKTRAPKLDFDLVGMAGERVRLDGIRARTRPETSELQVFSNKKAFENAMAPLAGNQDLPTFQEALKQMGAAVENLFNSVQKNTNEEITALQKLLTIQDEELQMLWWMVSGWSQMWDASFIELDRNARPILLAEEAAKMTRVFSESPSLKAVFYRLEIDDSTQLTIPEAVNACGVERLRALAPKEAPCPTIYPLHSAMFRALETEADTTWIGAWSKIAGISKKSGVLPLELALQIYREQKLMTLSEDSDE